MILFLILGLIAFIIGVLSIVSSSFDQYLHRLFPDSEVDKKLFSERNRYVIRRYVSGIQGILAGMAGIALYVFSNDQLVDRIADWFHSISN